MEPIENANPSMHVILASSDALTTADSAAAIFRTTQTFGGLHELNKSDERKEIIPGLAGIAAAYTYSS